MAEARRLVEDYRTQMLGLAKIVASPREAFDQEATALERRIKDQVIRNLLFAGTAFHVLLSLKREIKLENRHALLRAAFKIQAEGESALPAEFGTCRKTARGFELTGESSSTANRSC